MANEVTGLHTQQICSVQIGTRDGNSLFAHACVPDYSNLFCCPSDAVSVAAVSLFLLDTAVSFLQLDTVGSLHMHSWLALPLAVGPSLAC